MTGTLWSIAAIAGRTDLIGILPRKFAEELADGFNLALHETPMPISSQPLYMIWHERNERDIGHRWLRQRLMGAARAVFGPADGSVAAVPLAAGGGAAGPG